MQSKVRLLGHPLHPMIIPFPIAFNTTTMVCCMVYAGNGDMFWYRVAFGANCAAIAMSAIAVLPGLIDWLSIPELTDAKTTGLKHMVANVFSLGFFVANAVIMFTNFSDAHPPIQTNVIITIFGFLIMLYAGFQGWTLVQKHHVGVEITPHEEIPEKDESVEKNASEIFTDTTNKSTNLESGR
jgi:uncharacterized membrane protein